MLDKNPLAVPCRLGVIALAALLAACAAPPASKTPSPLHLDTAPRAQGKVPEFATAAPLPKPPKRSERPELYSVVVHNMNAQDLLFALARDAKLNVSVHPNISGMVTMSMIDQTLIEILGAIAKQIDLRYELQGKNLTILPDTPFLKVYRVDYPNIARNAESTVSVSVNVASTGSGSGSGSNASETTVKNTSNNQFWATITANLRDILQESDKIIPAGGTAPVAAVAAAPAPAPVAAPAAATAAAAGNTKATGNQPATTAGAANTVAQALTPTSTIATAAPQFKETASVIANPENGVINIRATQRQHDKVREFLDGIMESARRQVLIEATIVEVDLSDGFQQGINWSVLHNTGNDSRGFGSSVSGADGLLTGGAVSSVAGIIYNRTIGNTSIASALTLLESFGTLRVLSSPKISVLNSQTSVLKVVDNEVYFTITVTPGTPAAVGVAATPATYSSTFSTVPIGFLMTVTPQISANGEVILNLRPTISRISKYVSDPNPELTNGNVAIQNLIPVVQTREMESILRVNSGELAVLGGLIQDTIDNKHDGLPGSKRVPFLSNILGYTNNASRKTELVIFLRPTVLADASINGDFNTFRETLPDARKAFLPRSAARAEPAQTP
jgi:MSHA biogenesis protein MshL